MFLYIIDVSSNPLLTNRQALKSPVSDVSLTLQMFEIFLLHFGMPISNVRSQIFKEFLFVIHLTLREHWNVKN